MHKECTVFCNVTIFIPCLIHQQFFLLFISSYLSLYNSIRYHTTVKARFCFQAAGSFVISLFFFQDELFLNISNVMQRYGSLDLDHVLIWLPRDFLVSRGSQIKTGNVIANLRLKWQEQCKQSLYRVDVSMEVHLTIVKMFYFR